MPEEITFTTAAFGGFEKKQVLDYILKIHEEIDKDKGKQRKKLEDISYAFKELEQRAIKAEREKELFQQQLSTAAVALQSEKSMSENLRLSKQEVQQKLEQTERILAQRKNQEDSPVEQFTQAPFATQEQISYDQSAQIGKVMLDAHSKANRIVEEAKQDATKIIGEAHHNLDVRMKQNDAYIQQYTTAKEEEAKQAVSLLQSRAYSQISGIYDYLDSLLGKLIATADDSKSQFSNVAGQVNNIRASWHGVSHSGGTASTPPTTPPTPPQPPQPPNQEDTPANLDDYRLSEKYSSLFEFEPNVIEKPRIEYSSDYPHNYQFPEAPPQPIPQPIPLPEYPPIEHEPAPVPPTVEEGYAPQYTAYDTNQNPPPSPPAEHAVYSPAQQTPTPEQPYAYPQGDGYGVASPNPTDDTPDTATKRSLVFNFEHARPEDLSSRLDSDEITFPSLHPVDFSQPPTEND